MENETIRMLRAMAWSRAKGELQSMMQTYWHNDNYEPMREALDDFIKLVEDNGLQE